MLRREKGEDGRRIKRSCGVSIPCLKCAKTFKSIDRCRNRICLPCSRVNAREEHVRIYKASDVGFNSLGG